MDLAPERYYQLARTCNTMRLEHQQIHQGQKCNNLDNIIVAVTKTRLSCSVGTQNSRYDYNIKRFDIKIYKNIPKCVVQPPKKSCKLFLTRKEVEKSVTTYFVRVLRFFTKIDFREAY